MRSLFRKLCQLSSLLHEFATQFLVLSNQNSILEIHHPFSLLDLSVLLFKVLALPLKVVQVFVFLFKFLLHLPYLCLDYLQVLHYLFLLFIVWIFLWGVLLIASVLVNLFNILLNAGT